MSTGEPALLVQGVTKEFHRQGTRHWPWQRSPNGNSRKVVAIDDVSLTIQPREIFGVLGANGSGKSTLIRLVSTLLLPDRGAVTVFGHDVVKEEQAVKRLISRVSVDAAFFKKLSPMENLIYSARLYDLDAGPARERAIEIMGRLGIERKRVFEPMEEMSRGMQQKVAIARGFLTSPVLMLLDEPTTGLDPRSKREVQRFVLDLRQGHEATILLTTHDMAEADRLCDRIAILEGGKVIALDTPEGLKRLAREHDDHRPTLEDAFMILTGHGLEGGDIVESATPPAETAGGQS